VSRRSETAAGQRQDLSIRCGRVVEERVGDLAHRRTGCGGFVDHHLVGVHLLDAVLRLEDLGGPVEDATASLGGRGRGGRSRCVAAGMPRGCARPMIHGVSSRLVLVTGCFCCTYTLWLYGDRLLGPPEIRCKPRPRMAVSTLLRSIILWKGSHPSQGPVEETSPPVIIRSKCPPAAPRYRQRGQS